MTYLAPPPAPAPVIVVKDYGGLVSSYEAQTEIYRRTNREVRVHECHSACTLALSLPNVCVYPNSIFKFHQAYDLRNHATDYGVSQQLFDAYPAPVRARLGYLTRSFKILTGSELIALGIRDCNAPRVLIAKAHPNSPRSGGALARVWTNIMTAFGDRPVSATATRLVAGRRSKAGERHLRMAAAPLPPTRPDAHAPAEMMLVAETERPVAADVPLPPTKPTSLTGTVIQALPDIVPRVITGAQPILPPRFLAYVVIARLSK